MGLLQPIGGEMSQLIGKVGNDKNKSLQVNIEEYKGVIGVDIREWYSNGAAMMPTTKGVRIPLNQVSQVITYLEQAEQQLVKSGQLNMCLKQYECTIGEQPIVRE